MWCRCTTRGARNEGGQRRHSSRRAGQVVEDLARQLPRALAELLLERALGPLPERQRLAQARAPFLRDRERAAAPPALVPDRDEPFRLERPQVPRERAAV